MAGSALEEELTTVRALHPHGFHQIHSAIQLPQISLPAMHGLSSSRLPIPRRDASGLAAQNSRMVTNGEALNSRSRIYGDAVGKKTISFDCSLETFPTRSEPSRLVGPRASSILRANSSPISRNSPRLGSSYGSEASATSASAISGRARLGSVVSLVWNSSCVQTLHSSPEEHAKQISKTCPRHLMSHHR
jgi:hypothetical protein